MSSAEEAFRQEVRSWLETNLPAEWRHRGIGGYREIVPQDNGYLTKGAEEIAKALAGQSLPGLEGAPAAPDGTGAATASSASRTSPRATAAAPIAWSRRSATDRQASSRSTTFRSAGRRWVNGTSETFGTNEAAIAVAIACSCSSNDRMPRRPSVASSSRM